MPTTTGELGLTIPTDQGSSGVWGVTLNAAMEDIDTKSGVGVSSRLKKSGGAMTGRLDLHSTSSGVVAKGSISGTQSLDLSAANVFTATIAGATDFDAGGFLSVPTGLVGFILILTNGGANVTWPTSVKWPNGTVPTLTSAGVDVIAFITINGGVTWRGNVVMFDSK